MYEALSPEQETRIINGTVELAHNRLHSGDVSSSLFTELPYAPETYPGQAPLDFFAPARPSSGETLMEEGSTFCPNLEELVDTTAADTRLWETISFLVSEGYQVVDITNHRSIPDVAVKKLVEALILSKPEYLGDDYFKKSSIVFSKPISFFGYGEVPNESGEGTRPRSAIETVMQFTGVELVLPGTLTTKSSAQITEEDRKAVNTPIFERRQQMHSLGGLIIGCAGSASEDLSITFPGGKTVVIQQPMSKGTAEGLIGDKIVTLPSAVVFDELWNAHFWTGTLTKIESVPQAHAMMKLIASKAERMSGERTIYVNDHGAVRGLKKIRENISGLGTAAINQVEAFLERIAGDPSSEELMPE